MRICVIGTGYVGLVAGTCLADMGHNVVCVDNNSEKINQLIKGIIPIYEPDLDDLIIKNINNKRLSFTIDINESIKNAAVCFIAVPTPESEDGSCNLDFIFQVTDNICENLNDYKVIVNKSTVPVGTGEKITEIIKSKSDVPFDFVSNPEFLKQGSAVNDFLYPDRIIIGANSKKAFDIMQEIYSLSPSTNNKIIKMDIKSAEMTKYTANAFLASKISFINEISNICSKVGADIEKVRLGIASDTRIGSKFLHHGIGYGGSCFPKDVSALIKIAETHDYNPSLLKAVKNTNFNQRKLFFDKILKYYNGDINGKVFGVWGLAFKPNTNDMREAPSISVINMLIEHGAKVKAFDPKAMDNASKILTDDNIIYEKSLYDAVKDTDALILFTEWMEFKNPDYNFIKSNVKDCVIFDARNLYNKSLLTNLGINYITL